MLRKIFATIIAATAVGLVGILNASADHGQLPGDEIKKLIISGAIAKGQNSQGADMEVRFGADGFIKLDVITGFSDTGKWTVDGDIYCSQWKKIRNGKKACHNVRHLNGNKYLWKGLDGASSNSWKFTK